MFFHPQQGRFRDTLLDSVETHGAPRIVERDGKLRIQVASLEDSQTLYAVIEQVLTWELVGVVVFARTVVSELGVLHIAVKDDYTAQGAKADQLIAFHLIEELRRVGNRISGIQGVRLAYKRGKVFLSTLQSVQ